MSELGETLKRYKFRDPATVVEIVFDTGIYCIALCDAVEMSLLEPGQSLECFDYRTRDIITITCIKEDSIEEEEEYTVTPTFSN